MSDIKLMIEAILRDESFKKGVADMGVQLDKAKKSGSNAFGGLKAGWLAVTAAIAGTIIAVRNLTNDFINSERSLNNLKSTMKMTGNYTKEAYEGMIKFSTSMQRATGMSDEVAMDLASMAMNLGATNENAQEVVKTAVGLNKILGTGMEQAIKAVVAAQGGHIELLRREIPALRDVKTASEGLNKIMELGARGYAISQAEMQTFGGQVKLLKENFGDLKEMLGGAFASGIKPTVKILNDFFASQQGAEQLGTIIKGLTLAFSVAGVVIADAVKIIISFVSKGMAAIKDFALSAKELFAGHFKEAGKLAVKGLEDMGHAVIDPLALMVQSYKDTFNAIKESQVQHNIEMQDVAVSGENNLTAIAQDGEDERKKKKEQALKEQEKLESEYYETLRGMVSDFSTTWTQGLLDQKKGSKTVWADMLRGFAKMISGMIAAEAAMDWAKVLAPGGFVYLPSAIAKTAAAAAILAAGNIGADAIEGYAKGTDSLPQDTVARVHAGERIVPAEMNVAGVSNADLMSAALRGLMMPAMAGGGGDYSRSTSSTYQTNNNWSVSVPGGNGQDILALGRRMGSQVVRR